MVPGAKSLFFDIDTSPLYWFKKGFHEYAAKTGLWFNTLLGFSIALGAVKVIKERSMDL